MASSGIFSSLKIRRSPPSEALLAPVELSDVVLLHTLASLSNELVSTFSSKSFFFQRKNCRSLVRKVEVLAVLLECLSEIGDDVSQRASSWSSPTLIVCLKELYMLLYRAKILLDYCAQSSSLWLLLQNQSVSGCFFDLNQEMSTLLDVLPLGHIDLGEDVKELIELLQKQARRSRFYIDKGDEMLKTRLLSFSDEFENGRTPNPDDLRLFFVENLGLRDAARFRTEIDFLEEQIINHEGHTEPSSSLLYGFVAIARYCRFLFFGFGEGESELQPGEGEQTKETTSPEIADGSIPFPKDFCCPISLDLMRDPVIVSTGQTYDRSSISRWIEEGHSTCPKTGQVLVITRLVPNRALRNLIMHWFVANGMRYDHPETVESGEVNAGPYPSKAAMAANRATVALLIQQLANGTPSAKAVAAREVRLLAKTGKENRAFIAEAGAIPLLGKLLLSSCPIAQENSVTAMLNLSIYDKNKGRIMDEEGCLSSIVKVLTSGLTTEAKENAAATLFSLSAVHDYKKRIADERDAIEALAELLRVGTMRGKKDAVTALFNLSTHQESPARIIEAGAIAALVGALENEGVAEEAAGALALIVRQPVGAEAVGMDEMAVSALTGMMRAGTPRGKENAVAALLELCRSGGAVATERVLRAPALAGLLQTLLFTGTKRARRKAASLARVFQRRENYAYHLGGLGTGYAFGSNSSATNETRFAGEVSVAVSITVPVL